MTRKLIAIRWSIWVCDEPSAANGAVASPDNQIVALDGVQSTLAAVRPAATAARQSNSLTSIH